MAKKEMSDEHKAALAKGRAQGRAVREYLEAVAEGSRPGRRLSPDEIRAKIEGLHQQIEEEDNAAKRVELIQRRLDYEDRLSKVEDAPDMEALERGFVEAAQEYSERKGITYTAWREAGVPAAVLKQAGVPRTRRTA
ncbi:MAG: hypothetical protein KY457_09275 [Actinobacteria bacterium]|nr:hypothetical protein [Actinomycetota bacterium]